MVVMTIELHIKAPDGSNQIILLDNADAMVLVDRKWHLKQYKATFYVQTHVVVDGKRTSSTLHRLLMQAPKGWEVSHINGNGLDNRRENLRLRKRVSASGHQGITWHIRARRWHVVGPGPEREHWGYYKTLDDAVAARQAFVHGRDRFQPRNGSMGRQREL